MARAEIEWRDSTRTAGCLRIGGDNYNDKTFDDYQKSCTVFADCGRIEVMGWDREITTADYRAMEYCFLRERMSEYVFERYENNVCVHRRHKRWNVPLGKWKNVNVAS